MFLFTILILRFDRTFPFKHALIVDSKQQREEKQLEASVDLLISRVAHLKNALHNFIYNLENEFERLAWYDLVQHCPMS